MGLSDLPLAPGRKHAKAFERFGWTEVTGRRGRDNHILLVKQGHWATLSIPDHREVKRPLLSAQLKKAGITDKQYLAEFNKV